MRTLNSHSCLGKTPIIRDKITLIMITRTGSHSNQSPRISIDTRDRSALTLLLSSSQAPQRPLMLQKRRSHHFLITSDSFKGVGDRKSYATAVTITTYIVLSPKTRRCIQFRSVEVLLRAYALHEFPSLSFSTESSLLSLPSQTPSSTEEALQSISTACRIRFEFISLVFFKNFCLFGCLENAEMKGN